MLVDDVDPAAMAPQDFARWVRATPRSDLARILGGERRAAFLGGIFVRMPTLFRADRAGATEAVIHWCIGGRADGGADTFQLVVAGGACELSATADRVPRLVLSLAGLDFLDLVSSSANPMTMFVLGRMKAKGDVGLAARIPRLFDIPKP